MTRRSFLSNLAGALAVLVLPAAVKAAARERIIILDENYIERAENFRREWSGLPPRYDWTGERWVRRAGNTIGAPSSADLDASYDVIFLRGVPRIFA